MNIEDTQMLEQLQVNDYKFPNYAKLNDNLIYLDHIDITYNFNEVSITPDVALRYRGNLFGLFKEMRIDTNLYVFTMYINGYKSPVDFDGKKYTFKLAIKPLVPNS